MRPAGAAPQAAILLLGVLGIALAMLMGRSDILAAILQPPPPANLLLAGAAAVVALVVLLRAVQRVAEANGDPRMLIRGVRLVFLAVAAFAAAGGWLLDVPVAIVAALIIAGIDVIETTFLLLVTAAREEGPDGRKGHGEGR